MPLAPDTAEMRFCACGHFDFESTVTGQNDEFKAVLIARIHVCQTSKNQPTNSIFSSIPSYAVVKCICRNIKLFTRRTKLALKVKC